MQQDKNITVSDKAGLDKRGGADCSAQAQPFKVLRPQATAPILFVADHASNHIPADFNRLGVAAAVLGQHMAVDIGTAPLAGELSRRFDATAVLCGFSRLLADANRPLGDPACMPERSDTIEIPGNRGLSWEARRARGERYHEPYHQEVALQLGRLCRGTGGGVAFISLHSFTPEMNGKKRPWSCGVLWSTDGRIARPLISALSDISGTEAGDNLPYSGVPYGYSLHRHAKAQGLPHAALEIRQDLIDTPEGVTRWADILEKALRRVLDAVDPTAIEWY